MESEMENCEIYTCSSYLRTTKEGFSGLRENFCDARLVAGNKTFHAHKIILAANSRYFYSIFVHNFNERDSEEVRMPPEINADALETLLNYFYSGDLGLSQGNVESLFTATDYMRLDPLLEICIEYMQKTLDPSNCIRRYVLAEAIQYFSPSLDNFKRSISELIMEEIVKVSANAELLGLTEKLFSKILRSNNQPEKAETLYMVILKWVAYEEESRREFLCDLLQMLPVDGISDHFFTSRIKNEELLRRDPKSVLWLVDIAMSRIPPISASQTQSLFIADTHNIQTCFLVNLQNSTSLAIHNRPLLEECSVVSYKKHIYLLCGAYTEASYRLNEPHGSWANCDLDLKFWRSGTGSIVLGDELFVIGGWDWPSDLYSKACAKFNFALARKELVPATKSEGFDAGVSVYANSVYVSYGIRASPSLERFDAREGLWCAVGGYATKIGTASLATVGDYLYSCERWSGQVERFDFRANRLQKICSLPSESHGNYCISSANGVLLGADGGRISKYEIAAGKWNSYCSLEHLQNPVIVPWM